MFRIQTNASFDYELSTFYDILIEATDLGSPPLTGTTPIRVNIKDLNDNPPEFNQTTYELFANQDSYVGQRIAILTGTDKDSGDNALLKYSLEGPDAAFLSVNEETGEIYTTQALNKQIGNML